MDEYSIGLMVDGSSGSPELERALILVFKEYLALWKIKQRKYGTQNIAKMGMPGLIHRMNDKFERLKNFVLGHAEEDAEGGERDAWQDNLGYSAMGIILYDGNWPGVEMGGFVTLANIWHLIKVWLRRKFKWLNQSY